jgi:drug/metabolite transporter (DMT)-like permease
MTGTAVILLLMAAVAHASWNVLGKRGTPSAAFFLMANLAAMLGLSCLGVIYWHAVRSVPRVVWFMLAMSGLCLATYFIGLSQAYRLGHLSIAYPLARAMPVLLVAAFNFLIGRGEQIGKVALAGMVLVGIGCVMLPMRRFREIRLANYLHASSAMALVAALGTCGYSLIDSEALRRLREFGPTSIGAGRIAGVYLLLETAATSLALSAYVMLSPAERLAWRRLGWRGAISATAAAALIAAGYGLALAAMAFVSNVSYVVAFRQVSIPMGAALGIVLLKEPCPPPKAVGMMVLMAGLAMVARG